VAESAGAGFPEALRLPESAQIVSKAMTPEADAYSGFAGTQLNCQLAERKVKRVFIGGLTTDYCVLQTTLDARRSGYDVVVVDDAIAAVNVQPGDGARAIEQMKQHGRCS
jgi:nicotinamidase/pyrazinamidase